MYKKQEQKNMEQQEKERRFTTLIEEYRRVIYKICYMYATDDEEFKDLYQEVVLHLWRGFDSYAGKGKLSSWIYRIGLNTCISYYRQKRSRGERVSLDCRNHRHAPQHRGYKAAANQGETDPTGQ